MGFAATARQLPGRLTTGAFILNAGVGKWSADEETAARLHGMAVGTYPFLAQLKPKDFARLLAASEIALGSALLLPVVPAGMRQEGSLRPAQQGTALAKDVWMLGIGLSLLADALTDQQARPAD
jgi:hypothetical protein